MDKTSDIRTTRIHAVLEARLSQLTRNLLVATGGKPYIDERLSRFPSESQASWAGSKDRSIRPRAERCFLTNYAGRILTKIGQYVFAQGTTRKGIDPAFEKDATKSGISIEGVMRSVLRSYLSGQWAWIGIDRGSPGIDPATGKAGIRSIADRKAQGDRVFFSVWGSDEVVDWSFAADGGLSWLITQEDLIENSDVAIEAATRRIRTIWTRQGGTRLNMKIGQTTEVESEEAFLHSAGQVPFVLVGQPSAESSWFDDVEQIQASILNLESANHENLIRCVFPQLIVPSSLIQELMQMGGKTFDDALELVRGIEWPMMEPTEANGLTRLLMPSAVDLKAIPDEILRRRKELFDVVGQAMQSDTKQVSSAESKAWDHQDIEAALAENASVLEEAEAKAVAIAKKLDNTFPEYVPVYPRQFDLPNIEADMAIVTQIEASTGDLPEAAVRQLIRTKVEILDRIIKMPPEVKAAALKEIDDMDLSGAKEAEAMARARLEFNKAAPKMIQKVDDNGDPVMNPDGSPVMIQDPDAQE
jgi:hypothetical protein